MQILVLGGTSFVGRAIVDDALRTGFGVTLFSRGKTGRELFAGVPRLAGDRDTGDYAALRDGRWDAVVDVSGYVPRHVGQAMDALGDRVGRYLFLSSHAVYQQAGAGPGSTEDTPRRPAVRDTEELTGETYGPLKVACEDDVTARYGDRATIVRPGKVGGPHDNQDSLTYWVRRAANGGRVALPADPDQPVQVIDSRDLARLVVQLLTDDRPARPGPPAVSSGPHQLGVPAAQPGPRPGRRPPGHPAGHDGGRRPRLGPRPRRTTPGGRFHPRPGASHPRPAHARRRSLSVPPSLPSLIVVSGPPGSGKTTLAHRIGAAIGCPAICRDELKEGMAHTIPDFNPRHNDDLSLAANVTFFAVLETLLRAGVTTVAEAAFQDHLWRPGLEPLRDLARIRIVHCTVAPELAFQRSLRRSAGNPHRRAHPDPAPGDAAEYLDRLRAFHRIALAVPLTEVDTTDGYQPGLDEIVAFASQP